jgi:hypothetical protein
MNVQQGVLLLALGVLTLTIGAVARVHHRNGSITGNPKPVLAVSEDADQAKAQRGMASDMTQGRQSDDKLKEQLQDALDDKANIVVESVEHGVVTLSGRAEELSSHLRAVELVANFSGVKRVKSSFQTPDALSGIDIQKNGRESTAHPEDAFWNAWMVVPIERDDE